MRRLALVIIALLLAASPVLARTEAKTQKGIASVYASRFVGHKTASGELLDRSRFTAAHRSLPFGTVLEVTNRHNGRKIIVIVNDRGPHRRGRIIDLSPAAASELGMRWAGLVPVEIRIAERR